MKKNKYSIIVNANLEYVVNAKTKAEAINIVENLEMPKEYVSNSFEIVKTYRLKVDKKGYMNYKET